MQKTILEKDIQNIIHSLSSSSIGSEDKDVLENELCEIIESRIYNLLPYHSDFVKIVYMGLSQQMTLSEIDEWKLLHCLLRNFFFTNIGIENTFTTIRRNIFLESVSTPYSFFELHDLVISIASQNYKNEYAHFAQQDEINLICSAKKQLENLVTNGDVEDAVLLISKLLMYVSPLDLVCINKVDVGSVSDSYKALEDFIKSTVDFHHNEVEVAMKFIKESCVNDETSVKVSSMYKENPYPRWTEPLVGINPDKVPLEHFTGVATFPSYKAIEKPIKKILVAGCGTGKHPIQLALNYPWVDILAIDISPRSISYASLMAEKAKVSNITFKVFDILDLHNMEMQFDMIDSIGVIHHMSNPEEGLKKLLTRLSANGLLRLGLYSKAARDPIIQFRNNFKCNRSKLDQDKIRSIRHDIIENYTDSVNEKLLLSHDFFSLSGCRDLILHEQETQYTIPDIKSLIDKYNLTFLGNGLPNNDLAPAIKKVCGQGAEIQDLDNWEKAEDNYPYLFAKMYNFFVQKQL